MGSGGSSSPEHSMMCCARGEGVSCGARITKTGKLSLRGTVRRRRAAVRNDACRLAEFHDFLLTQRPAGGTRDRSFDAESKLPAPDAAGYLGTSFLTTAHGSASLTFTRDRANRDAPAARGGPTYCIDF